MENASKALIIAGAVLIALLVIATATKVFYSTAGSADQLEGTMLSTEATTFNNQFLSYVGNNKSKAEVIALLNKVIVNNSKDPYHTVAINTNQDPKALISEVEEGVYKISIPTNGYDNEGYITNIQYSK